MINQKSVRQAQQAHTFLTAARADAALDILKKLVRKNPKWDRAAYLMGLCQIHLGEQTKAVHWYRKALAFNPDCLEALVDLGNIYLMQFAFEESAALHRRALKLKPDIPTSLSSLGVCLSFLGQMEEAEVCVREALTLAPNDPTARCNLGLVLKADKRIPEALDAFKSVLEVAPNHLHALENLLKAAEFCDRLEAHRAYLDHALQLAPDNDDFVIKRIWLMRRDGAETQAIADLTAMIERRTEQFEKTCQSLKQAKRQDKEVCRRLSTAMGSQARTLANFIFELGKIEDSAKNFDAAFGWFEKGNGVLKTAHPDWDTRRQSTLTRISEIKDYFSQHDLSTAPVATDPAYPDMLFEVGFPRSGTTLLEAILDSHPDCVATDETDSFRRTRAHMTDKFGKRYPQDLDRLTPQEIEALQTFYFNDAKRHAQIDGKGLLIDKNPLNLIDVGFMRKVFPTAKILLVMRHPLDCGLSCYMQNFQMNAATCNFLSLEDTFHLYDRVFDLWDVFARGLSEDIALVLRYEDLVNDQEPKLKVLLSWLGLDWAEAVLDHSQSSQTFSTTPNYREVNQPIYRKAVARWKNYEDYVGAYEGAVVRYVDRFGYG